MFLNIKISKATPERALKYAIGKNILEETKTRNLITSKSPAEEMRDTASRYGKWQSPKDRKTFSLVISPNPKDAPTRDQVMEITEAVLDHFFPTIQGIIVLHKDKGKDSKKTSPVLHSHFYGSIIDPTTGKNIHLSDSDVRRIRAWADEYAMKRYNWRPFKRGTDMKGKAYKKEQLNRIKGRGKSGWMECLIRSVNVAYGKSDSFEKFCLLLREKNINVLQDTESKELKFEIAVKGKRYQVNARTIGDNFSWDKLQEKFMKLDNRRSINGRSKRVIENKKEAQLGSGSIKSAIQGNRAGENSGPGYLGKHRINYGCIFCTKDKDICRKCSEYKHRERELGHGSRSL